MNKFFQVLLWPGKKMINYTKAINTALEAPTAIKETTDKAFTYMTKLVGVSTGSVGAAKGSVDALEALSCQDGVCFIVSCVGVCADGLQIAASFVPGPNVTTLVTTPISLACKTFVWACKRSKLPWGGC